MEKKLKKNFFEYIFFKIDIRPNDPEKPARDFSGGNQQKAIFAKWMAIEPTIMILDERLVSTLVQKQRSMFMDNLSKKRMQYYYGFFRNDRDYRHV